MREVSTCDFCGEEAAGTFEVVPPERDPDGGGRRLVLCPGCRDTLESVLEPLVERDRSAEPGTAPGDETGTPTVVAEPERGFDGETATDPTPDTGSGPDAGSSRERGGGSATDGTSPGDGDAETSTDGEDGEDGEDGGDGGRPGSARRGAPRGYRKVMRFLENREVPLDRGEAETLVAEAYGMDREAVSAAVDHAVKHDRLREVSGDLRR